MTAVLGVLAAVGLFVLFGLAARGARRSCGAGACACGVAGSRAGCARIAGEGESRHEHD